MATEKQQNKISKVMREFYAGKLTTHGNKVTDVSQAKAIALSEAGVSNKKSSAKKKMTKGGQVISKYDDEKYMSKRHYLRDTIESFFGKQNVYFNSADWGGMPVWTVKGDLYEGTFIVMGDEDDVILMTRRFDSELGENVNNTLMQVEWQDINGLNDLLNMAMIIKNRGSKMAEGGSVDSEGIDLFEDYDNIPEKVQKVLSKYAEAFEEGDYDGLKKASKAVEKVGYTFEYGLDGIAYDLRPIGTKGKSEMEEFAKGGNIEKENKEMIASQVKEAKHHAEELSDILKEDKDIEAWVVAKMERATTDLSDVTHYLDGKNDKFADGGGVGMTKGVTEVIYEDNGDTIIYGSKNNKTKISVKGMSNDEIKDEFEFEKMMLSKKKDSVASFDEDKIKSAKGMTDKEKADAIKMQKQSILEIEKVEKIVIPFYQSKLKNYATGGGVDRFSDFDLNKEGNFEAIIDGKKYEIIYRDDVSQMYDLFEDGKLINSSKSVRDVMKFSNGGGVGDECSCDEGGVYQNPFLKSIFGI